METHSVQTLLVGLAVILVAARLLGRVATRLGQPPVIGEVLLGILLGPTLLPSPISEALFPQEGQPLLAALATVGVAWFMFAMGLDVEPDKLREGRRIAPLLAWSTLAPFVLGAGLAVILLPRHETGDPVAFACFVGLAMTATAFPILARILSDRNLTRTEVGRTALTVAAVVDLLVWIALAMVQAWVTDTRSWGTALVVPYLVGMLLVVRPFLRWLANRTGSADDPAQRYVVFLGLALLSAAATEAMGLHFIFGAFLAGAVIPPGRDGRLRSGLRERAEKLSAPLLPVYFVIAGQQVDLGALQGPDLAEGALILAVAVLGKAGATYIGARLSRIDQADSRLLAVLLNTRGLTEIIILGVGLQAGLLDQSLYSLMVGMAIITTAMTGPLITLHRRGERRRAAAYARTSSAPRSAGPPGLLGEGYTADPAPHGRSSAGFGPGSRREEPR